MFWTNLRLGTNTITHKNVSKKRDSFIKDYRTTEILDVLLIIIKIKVEAVEIHCFNFKHYDN